MDRIGIRKAGNVGLVTTTAPAPPAPGDLCHTMPTRAIAGPRSGRITKILVYNNTGANVPILLGTNDRAAVPAFVQLLPALLAINGLDNEWTEDDIPAVEWMSDESAAAAGRTGNIHVVAGAVGAPVAGVVVSIEIEEYGA